MDRSDRILNLIRLVAGNGWERKGKGKKMDLGFDPSGCWERVGKKKKKGIEHKIHNFTFSLGLNCACFTYLAL